MDAINNNGARQRKLRLVEIIGPAGAGKSTLCDVLIRACPKILLRNFPDVRKVTNAPFFISYGSQLIPTLMDFSHHGDRWLSRREFAWLTILNGWSNVLQCELKKNNDIILLDQGPVYLLTEASEFGPEYLRTKESAPQLMDDLYSRWANILDMVIWLDAADADLAERIRSRDKGHPVKHRSMKATLEFLGCYRNAYERTISRLFSTRTGLKVLRFDTSRITLDEIVCQLLPEFGVD